MFHLWARKTPNPLKYSGLGDPMDRGTWLATVDRVARLGLNLATKQPSPPQA